ncbi:MAG: hypothetical protein ABIU54_10390 [Candidatus Eisenbacteria bacterium]
MTMRALASPMLSTVALLATAAMALCVGPVRADGPPEATQRIRFQLSWTPPADGKVSQSRMPNCDDAASRDTLYLTFQVQHAESTFIGVQGELYVYAAPGDSLAEIWHMEKGGRNRGGAAVEFGPAESFPQALPWTGPGVGLASYDRTTASGHLRFVYALPAGSPTSLEAGRTYAAARIIFSRTKPELRGCEVPVCIEWRRAKFLFSQIDTADLQYGEGRWVARGPTSEVCATRVPSWRPNKSGAQP